MFSGEKGFGKFQYIPGNLEGYTHTLRAVQMLRRDLKRL